MAEQILKPTNPRIKDLTGRRFGKLVVISFARTRLGKSLWLCTCDCGLSKIITGNNLTSGAIQSCSCISRARAARQGHINVAIHSFGKLSTKHGQARPGKETKTHRAWAEMKRRCLDPKRRCYSYYGGRGIKVCPQWLDSFETFYQDMGTCPPDMTLDRFPDKNGDYEPDNCRWATKDMQANNTRRNVFITYEGQTLSVAQWAKIKKVSPYTLYNRVKKGFPPFVAQKFGPKSRVQNA